MSQEDVIVLRAGIPPLKGKKIRYYKDDWMIKASSVPPPPVVARPLDPSVARRSLAILTGGSEGTDAYTVADMTDGEALDGIDVARLAGFPVDLLPDDGQPASAAEFFRALGLTYDFSEIDFDAVAVIASTAHDDAEGQESALTAAGDWSESEVDRNDEGDALAFLKGANG